MGYIFQNFALVDDASIYDNLKIALKFSDVKKSDYEMKLKEALEMLNLEESLDKKVFQLSGGQQQRLAMARVFLKKCDIILADEPTGSLDRNTRDEIIDILKNLNDAGKTIIIVTHDSVFKDFSDKVYELL